MDTPLYTCYSDHEHAASIAHQLGCTVHCAELDVSVGVCRICLLEASTGILVDAIPFDQKEDSQSSGPDPATIVFGVIASVGAVASIASAAIAFRETRRGSDHRPPGGDEPPPEGQINLSSETVGRRERAIRPSLSVIDVATVEIDLEANLHGQANQQANELADAPVDEEANGAAEEQASRPADRRLRRLSATSASLQRDSSLSHAQVSTVKFETAKPPELNFENPWV